MLNYDARVIADKLKGGYDLAQVVSYYVLYQVVEKATDVVKDHTNTSTAERAMAALTLVDGKEMIAAAEVATDFVLGALSEDVKHRIRELFNDFIILPKEKKNET